MQTYDSTILSQIDALERAQNISVSKYDISLDLTQGPKTFLSQTTITFSASQSSNTFLEIKADKVHAISLNGKDLNPAAIVANNRITISNLKRENTLHISASMLYTNTGEGLHRFQDPSDGEVYLYSQFEVQDAQRVYPCFDQPDLKSVFNFTVKAPSNWTVLSCQSATAKETEGQTTTWTFAPTPIMSTYITAICAGPYSSWHDSYTSTSGREIPLGVFCRKSLAKYMDPENIIDVTKQGFAYYEKNFNYPYPFEKYDQIFVPEYNAGAMENIGCVTFTESYVFRGKVSDALRERRVVTVLHELAHMWFGNLVTMKWWGDLWLNESFAEFISTLATAESTEYTNNWVTFTSSDKIWGYHQDQLSSTHPIVSHIGTVEDVLVNFDGITYAKGASVLKQLFFLTGRDNFFKALTNYFTKYAYSNTTLRDLLAELQNTSGQDLTSWSILWLESAGLNTLAAEFEKDSKNTITSFNLTQTPANPPEHDMLKPTIHTIPPRPHKLQIGLYSLTDKNTLQLSKEETVYTDSPSSSIPSLIGTQMPDLVLINNTDYAYAKVYLDDSSLSFALTNVHKIEDPLARAVTFAALWDHTRDAKLKAQDYISCVLKNVQFETESTTRNILLSNLHTAATAFIPHKHTKEFLDTIAQSLYELLLKAEPDTDAQFAYARYFLHFALSPTHLEKVNNILTQKDTIPGLKIDEDFTWQLLAPLARAGIVDKDTIRSYLEADNTANGRRGAAACETLLPTPEDKQYAWVRAWDRDEPNDIIRTVADNFWDPFLPDLADYVPMYFKKIIPTWQSKSFHIAQYLVEGFFPWHINHRQSLSLAQKWLLNHADQPPALRRMVLDGADGLARTIRCQDLNS